MRRAVLALLVTLALPACASPEARTDVVYDSRSGSARMDVYLPPGEESTRPAVMLIHGGAWRGGDRFHFTATAERLAQAGYVAATIDYRLVPEGVFPAAVQDCLCALAYLRAHAAEFRVDPARIAVMGYSAGSHLASLLAVASQHPELAPDCAGARPELLTAPAAVIAASGAHDLRGRDHDWVVDFMGVSERDAPERWALASPITHVRAGLPPFLLMEGADDWLIETERTEAMQDALKAAGVEARLFLLDGGGHLFTQGTDNGHWFGQMVTESPEAWAVVIDFLDRHLGGH